MPRELASLLICFQLAGWGDAGSSVLTKYTQRMVSPPYSMLAPLSGIAGAPEVHEELLLDLHFTAYNIKPMIQGETELLEVSNALRRKHHLEKE